MLVCCGQAVRRPRKRGKSKKRKYESSFFYSGNSRAGGEFVRHVTNEFAACVARFHSRFIEGVKSRSGEGVIQSLSTTAIIHQCLFLQTTSGTAPKLCRMSSNQG